MFMRCMQFQLTIGTAALLFAGFCRIEWSDGALISYAKSPYFPAYRPVVIVHGIFDSGMALLDLKLQIEVIHPGTQVHLIPLYQDIHSTWPMWTQVTGFYQRIRNISDSSNGTGIILIGYSQGGLICRGVIQADLDEKLNIHTYISLASPQLGQYGDTSYLRYLFPNYTKRNVWKLLYSRFGQTFSVGGYWKDPHQYSLYQTVSLYLPILNNETGGLVANMTLYKRNFTRLKKVILIGGPDDGVITPWQSSHFGFYDLNETVVDMQQQDVYINDPFGLRTMDKRGDLVLIEIPGVHHTQWHWNPMVFHKAIMPWLS